MPNRRRFRVPSLSGSVHEREHSSFGSEASELHHVNCKTQSPQDRELRERLHAYRYLMFQHGQTIREIAETEGVDERQIYLSISHCETRLPRAEVIANRNFRNAMVAQRRLAEKYVDTVQTSSMARPARIGISAAKHWNISAALLARKWVPALVFRLRSR